METLLHLGVDTVFSVSGNQIMSVFDAAGDEAPRIIHCRHESGAVYMAEAWARVRDVPGVCLVTAGPGHTSAITGLANANASETPLLMLSGASPASQTGMGAFQEMNQASIALPVVKASMHVASGSSLVPSLLMAWQIADSMVPGPVSVTVPQDILEDHFQPGQVADAAPPMMTYPLPAAPPNEGLVSALLQAKRPVLLLRPSLARARFEGLLKRLQERIPVFIVQSPRGLNDPAYGDRARLLSDADFVAVFGPLDFAVRFGAVSEKAEVYQVTSRIDELKGTAAGTGNVHSIWADEVNVLSLIDSEMLQRGAIFSDLATTEIRVSDEAAIGSTLHPLAVCEAFRTRLRPEDILVMDGGEFGQWVRAGFRDLPNRQLINGKLGAIGGSIPHGVGAALAAGRQSRAFVFVGDGAFGYYASELDTAVRAGINLTVVIGNDARWSAEWHHQRKTFGELRTYGTELEWRAYERVAEGYGARGISVNDMPQLLAAVSSVTAVNHKPTVACLNVRILSCASPTGLH